MQTSTCDLCDKSYPTDERRVMTSVRPSDPTELCAVVWGCGAADCDSADWPTADQVAADVEAGKYPGIVFVTV